MSNPRSNVVTTQSVPPKTTKMNRREKKPANMTGSGPSMYPKGHFGNAGNGLKK
jgi:hypothetical protein